MVVFKKNHFRWMIVGLLFFITITNYIDRASISYAIDEMITLFHLSDTQAGLILGAFGIGYAVTTFLGGIAVDRYGSRITLFIAVLLWSLAIMLTGLATGFLFVLITRALLGLSEGPNFPGMTRAIGDWLPKKERASALSYALIAVPIALAIGGPIVSELIIYVSWRGMFIVLGIISLIWLPFWWFLFHNFPEQSKKVSENELQIIREGKNVNLLDEDTVFQERKAVKNLWPYLFSNPTLISNYWAFFVFGYYLFFFMTWLPNYLLEHYHLHLAEIGLFTVLPWTLAAIMMWIVGRLSDYIFHKTESHRWSRSFPIWISQLIAAVCIIPIIFTNDAYIAILFISLAVGFSMSANGTFYAVNIDVAKKRAGTALGIMDTAFALSGFLAPAITGWSVTVTGNFKTAFVLLAILGVSSVIVVLLFHQPDTSKKLES